MFGLSFSSCELIQGPAVRTWNCVAHFANLLWYKFYHTRQSIMPRSRRRHHSRSRTRSRSHSYERDREPKRRKIESCESPHKRSYSPNSENEDTKPTEMPMDVRDISDIKPELDSSNSKQVEDVEDELDTNPKTREIIATESSTESSKEIKSLLDNSESDRDKTECKEQEQLETDSSNSSSDECDDDKDDTADKSLDFNTSAKDSDSIVIDDDDECKKKTLAVKVASSKVTPKKVLSPKQLQKKLESEKKRQEKFQEREKKAQERLEQKLKEKQEKQKQREEKEQQKLKEKLEKQEQKQKELEEKQKEKELKEEKKKKEREEKEQKRKEKEEKIEQKRKEQEEKNKEKQREEEKKQKAAAVFANFFFMKKLDTSTSEDKKLEDVSLTFMPFEVKSDMRLAPLCRKNLSSDKKEQLDTYLITQSGQHNYLKELCNKEIGKSAKTWLAEDPDSDDVIIIEEENPGERIEEQQKNTNKMRAKLFKFRENRRPAYFGTWRKKSKFIKPRKPLALDMDHFDYDFDSDDDWEEGEDAGESLHGSDDEDKENESDEYEVDNEFFVPHGHLSDDEVNDEDEVVSPEAHKAKLKLLKKEFEEEIKAKTQKIKPRVIGCIWYNKDGSNVDSAIREFLKPFSIISNGQVKIKKRSEFMLQASSRKSAQIKMLSAEFMPDFLKCIHGNTKNRKKVVEEFLETMQSKNIPIDLTRASLSKQMKLLADWAKCQEDGPMRNKLCWVVRNDVKSEYNVDLSLANKF